MPHSQQRSWIEISEKALNHNLSTLKKLAGDSTALVTVVKANAYGHGVDIIAPICDTHPDVTWLGVVGIQEALNLRALGMKKPILVLGYWDADPALITNKNIILSVHTTQQLKQLEELGKTNNSVFYVHIKVDTGLSRLGVPVDHAIDLIKQADQAKHVELNGIFTHLSAPNDPDQQHARGQLKKFDSLLESIKLAGITVPHTHAGASGSLHIGTNGYTLVRTGTSIYGYKTSSFVMDQYHQQFPDAQFKPILCWKSKISTLRTIKTGTAVGYNTSWKAPRTTVVATLPIGYYDGYPHAISNKACAMIKGRLAPLIGEVSMNLVTFDVTDIPNVCVEDVVTLIGDYDGIRINDLALCAGVRQNEIPTRLNNNIKRILV
ncbi:alanine racemase [bacterium]|nr:alanine racemase [bacterium]